MIDRTHPLSLAQQTAAVGIGRGSIYYVPTPVRAADLALMRRRNGARLTDPDQIVRRCAQVSSMIAKTVLLECRSAAEYSG